MRELKFRVWDVNERVFRCNGYTIEDFNKLGAHTQYSGDGWGLGIDYKIQQYTGLKDKNGKEIYEGDIVRAFTVNDSEEFYAPIEFSPQTGYFLNNPIESIDRHWYDGGVSVGPQCEVVGNIFENPELLKQ